MKKESVSREEIENAILLLKFLLDINKITQEEYRKAVDKIYKVYRVQ